MNRISTFFKSYWNTLVECIRVLVMCVYYFLKFTIYTIKWMTIFTVPTVFLAFILGIIGNWFAKPNTDVVRVHRGRNLLEHVDTTKMCPTNKSDRFTVVAKSGYEPKREDTCSVCHHPFLKHSLSEYQENKIRDENYEFAMYMLSQP